MKNYIIGAGALLVIVLAVWVLKPNKSSAPAVNEVSTETDSTNNSVPNTTTTKPAPTPKQVSPVTTTSLFPKAGSYECRYEQVTPESRSTNIVYVADGKMRGEFRTLDSKGMGSSNIMVYDGTYLYIWIEGQTVGTRSQPKTLADIPAVIPTNIKEGMVLGSGINNVSWNCHAWSKVSSMLTKPTYVRF